MEINKLIEIISSKLVGILCVLIMMLLTVFSFLYTEYDMCIKLEMELMLQRQNDKVGILIIEVLFALTILVIIDRFFTKLSIDRNLKYLSCCGIAICFLVGLFWINQADWQPDSDQYSVCLAAYNINHNNFVDFEKGNYIARYPFQLGLMTVVRILYKMFESEMIPRVFHIINALTVPVTVLALSKITEHISRKKVGGIMTILLCMFCLPIVFYTPYMYGELLSIMFCVLTIWFVLILLEKMNYLLAVVAALTMGMAVFVRNNSLIIFIALFILVIVKMISDKDIKKLVIIFALALGIILQKVFINCVYGNFLVGVDNMPFLLWIAMGMQERILDSPVVGPGWYNAFPYITFIDNGYNYDIAVEIAKQSILSRLAEFKNSPAMMMDFYLRKIETQWNAPLFLGLAFNNCFSTPPEGVAASVYYGNLYDKIYLLENVYQSVIFVSVVTSLVELIRKTNDISKYILAIIVVGGFLFSLMWEASSRYVFPYYVMMLPYAAIGINTISNAVFARGNVIRHIQVRRWRT